MRPLIAGTILASMFATMLHNAGMLGTFVASLPI